MIWIVFIQIIFSVINVAMAWYHAKLIKQNKPIEHGWWAFGYFVVALPVLFLNWLLFASLFVLRLPLFNTVLNKLRGLPIFYMGKGSIIDRLISKYYPYVFWGCIALFITIEIILLW
ncbi:MAG: hypothetical protein ACTHLE_04205 [Agriterribacter sp.]